MTTIDTRHIVAGIDGSDHGAHALEWAVQLGRTMGLPVKVIYAWQYVLPAVAYGMIPIETHEEARATGEAVVREAAAPYAGDPTVAVTASALQGDWHEFVEATQDAWIVVLGAHHEHVLRGLIGSFANKCVSHAKAATVIVPLPTAPLRERETAVAGRVAATN